jgi:hypothetical protein
MLAKLAACPHRLIRKLGDKYVLVEHLKSVGHANCPPSKALIKSVREN